MPNQHLDLVRFDDSNPEARCPCILLLDVSGSMNGKAIEELNHGLSTFQREIQNDDLAAMRVEVSVVTFGNNVQVTNEFVTANQFEAKLLRAGGSTPMGQAINQSLDMLRARKDTYKAHGVPYYRPWVFLITDGSPTDEWQSAAKRVHEEEASKSIAFFAVGVQNADMQTLKQISVREPLRLQGLNFRDMFVWLSQSLASVSHSVVGEQVPLAPPKGWSVVD